MKVRKIKYLTGTALAALLLQSCTGIFNGIYDEPSDEPIPSVAGKLYIDASDWGKWYYIDLKEVVANIADNEDYDSNQAWLTYDIPMEEIAHPDGKDGIYTYWYDVFGAGISVNEFRSYMPTAQQEEPEHWTIAVHRNNVRTNGCMVAPTDFKTFDDIPVDRSFICALEFEADKWSENMVWCDQSKMLLGLIGSQGININYALSSWLEISIPPIPPAFTMNGNVFILRMDDGTYAAIRLEDYQSPSGVKCCLTINYRYPI
ncbi:MAG: HmuY family protein [Muribaculaceae bacterium]|nr:HmuY family protein [Muribaculaceae bacterium]